MICPKCSHNQKYKYGMKCSNCGYKFIFDPKRERRLSDMKVKRYVEILSENHTKYFTQNQVFGIYARQLASGSAKIFWGSLAAYIIGIITLMQMDVNDDIATMGGLFFGFGFLALIVIGAFTKFDNSPIGTNPLKGQFDDWKKTNQAPTFLDKKTLLRPPKQPIEKDIYNYGAESLLILDQDIYVDLLVKNGFHQQFKTVVISENLYPKYLIPSVQRMLEQNPEMPIFLLHNGDWQGESMKQRLEESSNLNLENREIIDLGLRHKQFLKTKTLQPYRKIVSKNYAPLDFLSYGQICYLFEHGKSTNKAFNDELEMTDTFGNTSIVDFG